MQEVIAALETVSEYFTENTPQNRRNLERMIDNAAIEANERFLTSFARVKEVH